MTQQVTPVSPEEEQNSIALNFFQTPEIPGKAKGEPAPNIEEEDKKKKEKEELERKGKEEEEGLKLERDKRKVKATPDESLAILRKQRDEEREKNKVFSEVFGENPPSVIKPVFDLIVQGIEGPVTEDAVKEFIENYTGTNKKLQELEDILADNEKKVSEIDIRYSDEFKNDFQKPYEDAAQSLFLEFANVTPDQKVIAPTATKALNDFLLANPDASAIEVKAEMMKFTKDYKTESGEDAVLPSVTSMMNSLRQFSSKAASLKDAYLNWSETKKKREIDRIAKSQEQSEFTNKALVAKRKELAGKAYREFDLDRYDFLSEADAEALFREEFNFGEGIRDGKVPEYNELITRGVKSRLWDKYEQELIDLRAFKEGVEKGQRNDLPGSNRGTVQNKGEEKIDWLTMKV